MAKLPDTKELIKTLWLDEYKDSNKGAVRIPQLPTPLLRKHITTITATTNAGKSTFSRALAMELIARGKNTIIYSTEETGEDFAKAFKDANLSDPELGKLHITIRDNVGEEELEEAFDYEDIDFVIFDYANTASLDGKDYARSLNAFMERLLKKVKVSKCHAFVIFQANQKAYSNRESSAIAQLKNHPGLIATFSEGGMRGISKAYNSYFIERIRVDNTYKWFYALCKTRIDFNDLYITNGGTRENVQLGDLVQYTIDTKACTFSKAGRAD